MQGKLGEGSHHSTLIQTHMLYLLSQVSDLARIANTMLPMLAPSFDCDTLRRLCIISHNLYMCELQQLGSA